MPRLYLAAFSLCGLLIACDAAPSEPIAATAAADDALTAGSGDAATPTGVPRGAAPVSADATTDAPLPIAEALADVCPNIDPKLPQSVSPGRDLHRLSLTAPDAVCNDGSPGIIYMRPAANAANRGRWIFHLQGGGGCSSNEDCADRWCGEQGIYDAAKMSSRWSPETLRGQGIFSQREANPFRDANHVYAYYCSSDSWLGQRSDTVLTSETGATPYQLYFRGHSIVEAMFAALREADPTSDDGRVVMPDLSAATQVLWTGMSAGSGGATHQLDWVAEQFDAAQTEVVGVFDAAFRAEGWRLGADIGDALDAQTEERWDVVRHGYQDAFVDTSCLAAHPDAQWRCINATYVRLNHITTPYFMRVDLRDPNPTEALVEVGATVEEAVTALLDTLETVPAIGTDGLEAASVTRTPGVYAPNCAVHVAITNDGGFLRRTLEGPNGIGRTFSDALSAWLRGTDVFMTDTHPATRSVCGAP